MALVTFSPIISDIRNAAGNAVFSRWKGRSYIRERVIPANPRSAAQTTQRQYLAKVVGWWHDLKTVIKDCCDTLGAEYQISGFNAFTARNVKDMADGVDERIIPLNTPENPVDNVQASTGSGSGEINVTWSQGQAEATGLMFAFVEPAATPAGQSNIAEGTWAGSTLASDESGTLTGLSPGVEYNIWLLVKNSTTGLFSVARKVTATAAS